MTTPQRVEGWKAIASYLNRGIRTVQRYERELGLPVRRLRRNRAEVVFVYPDEVDRWLQETATVRSHANEPPDVEDVDGSAAADTNGGTNGDVGNGALDNGQRPAETGWRSRPAVRWTAAIVVGAAALAASYALYASRTRNPVAAVVEVNELVAVDANGREIWRRALPGMRNVVTPTPSQTISPPRVTVRDLDGDGSNEVVVGFASGSERGGLVAFNHDGTTRFDYDPDYRIAYGPYSGNPPWQVQDIYLERLPDGRHRLWFVSEQKYYPSLLQGVDSDGRPLKPYWSDGFITDVVFRTFQGRRAVFVGANDNETAVKGGSLAILDADAPGATAPALDPDYRCHEGCESAAPMAFLVWPASPLSRVTDATEETFDLRIDTSGQIHLATGPRNGVRLDNTGPVYGAFRHYVLDETLAVRHAELGYNYGLLFRRYRELKMTTDGVGPDLERHLRPVLRWDGTQFTRIY